LAKGRGSAVVDGKRKEEHEKRRRANWKRREVGNMFGAGI
jgi:hypothetical protein